MRCCAAGANASPAYAKVAGNMARPSMVAGLLMGATAGFMLAYQNSSGESAGHDYVAAGH